MRTEYVIFKHPLMYEVQLGPGHESKGKVYVVDFVAREIIEWHKGDQTGFEYHRAGAVSGMDLTPDRALAEWHIEGAVKWDGCCNYRYNDAACMLHICGPADIDREAELLRAVFRLAYDFMPETRSFERPA